MNDDVLSATRDQIQRRKDNISEKKELSFTVVPYLEDGHAGSKHLGE
jgi:hypothetical protein